MKLSFGLIALLCLFAVDGARADAIDDHYVRIYNLIQEGDSLSGATQASGALAKYNEALAMLQKFQKSYPGWNTKVVTFRLNYLAGRIAEVSSSAPTNSAAAQNSRPQIPVSATPPKSETNSPPVVVSSKAATNNTAIASNAVVPAPRPAAPAVPTPSPVLNAGVTTSAPPATATRTTQPAAVPDADVSALKDQLRQLQADKILLEAKLKEALTAMPAATDPAGLAKAEERVRSLQKENQLLKTDLEQVKSRVPRPGIEVAVLQRAQRDLAEANRKLSEQTEKANSLAAERNALQTKVKTLEPNAWNAAALDTTRKALEEANRQILAQKEAATKLAQDKAALQTKLNALAADTDAAGALRAENQLLKKQLADLRSKPARPAGSEVSTQQLTEAQAQIAALRSDREILRLEKTALEDRLRKVTTGMIASRVPSGVRGDDSARVRELEKERDDLQKKLEVALKDIYGKNGKAAATRVSDLEEQLGVLRARLEVFEARQVPYTAEELALFKKPELNIAAVDPNAGKKPLRELPPGSATLVAEADRYFSAREYDKAEDRYLQVLHKDERNVPTLANLAAIQLEMNHLDEAEKHIRQAVTLAPEDSYSLSILGYLKFRQEKYDDALDALSKAAKIDPQNAQIQNYLGITLSQKGMRASAETALRKAIQLEPGYASAHHNLAVIYATQKPPLTELARWHYQKAINAGHPHNPQLEKLFDTQKPQEDKPVQKTVANGAGK